MPKRHRKKSPCGRKAKPAGPKLVRGRGFDHRRMDFLAPVRWLAYLLCAAGVLLVAVFWLIPLLARP